MSGKRYNRRRQSNRVMGGLLVVCVAALLVLISILLFQVDGYKVHGSFHQTDEEVMEYLMQGTLGHNSLYLALTNRSRKVPGNTFIDTITVNMKGPRNVEVVVEEKPLVGYVSFDDHYWYFDRTGTVRVLSVYSQADYNLMLRGGLPAVHAASENETPAPASGAEGPSDLNTPSEGNSANGDTTPAEGNGATGSGNQAGGNGSSGTGPQPEGNNVSGTGSQPEAGAEESGPSGPAASGEESAEVIAPQELTAVLLCGRLTPPVYLEGYEGSEEESDLLGGGAESEDYFGEDDTEAEAYSGDYEDDLDESEDYSGEGDDSEGDYSGEDYSDDGPGNDSDESDDYSGEDYSGEEDEREEESSGGDYSDGEDNWEEDYSDEDYSGGEDDWEEESSGEDHPDEAETEDPDEDYGEDSSDPEEETITFEDAEGAVIAPVVISAEEITDDEAATAADASAQGETVTQAETPLRSTAEDMVKSESGAVLVYIPLVEGLSFSRIELGQTVPGQNSRVFDMLDTFRTYVVKTGNVPDRIVIGEKMDLTACYGGAEVRLGTGDYLDERLNELKYIHPHLAGLTGILHLENFDGSQDKVIFSKK